MGLLKPLQGGVTLCGLPRQAIAYLPQQAEIDRSFPISVLDTVLLGHWRQVGAFRAMSPAMRDEAHAALAAVGLSGFENRPIGTLSSGQFQRVLFARTLLQDARLILLDEPFTAIDARTTADLLKVVHRWHGELRTAPLPPLEPGRFLSSRLIARPPHNRISAPQAAGSPRGAPAGCWP